MRWIYIFLGSVLLLACSSEPKTVVDYMSHPKLLQKALLRCASKQTSNCQMAKYAKQLVNRYAEQMKHAPRKFVEDGFSDEKMLRQLLRQEREQPSASLEKNIADVEMRIHTRLAFMSTYQEK